MPKYVGKSVSRTGHLVYKYTPERWSRASGFDETFPATHYVSRGGRRPKTLFLSGGSVGRSIGPGTARYYGRDRGFRPTPPSLARMKRLIRSARGF